ncbi:MAG: tail fiber domain-containing protein, partial [Rhodobacteraceae bacterium]|nr:tail fiber domain-containing protein [Paracoccaceae bacterium]
MPPQLDKIVRLNPVVYRYKGMSEESIGLIAEEVIKIYPEFISYDGGGKISGINYSKMTAVLIQGIKELKQIIDEQQITINKFINK